MSSRTEEFYSRLAASYDRIFPVEESILRFLRESGAVEGARVLDLACGTGLYTDALLAEGVDAYGIDLSSDLIDRARTRSAHPERFGIADMRDLPNSLSGVVGPGVPERFDLIFCIGNSISHLESADEVRAVIAAAADRLPGGALIVQFVDMESIPVGGARDLPTLETGAVRFERRYVRASGEKAVFEARLQEPAAAGRYGRPADHSISNELLILRTADVLGWLHDAGLADTEVWGSFTRAPVEASWVRVLTGSRERR